MTVEYIRVPLSTAVKRDLHFGSSIIGRIPLQKAGTSERLGPGTYSPAEQKFKRVKLAPVHK
jgi:hypothetical protein